ncbi:MAG: beta-ketoacyl-ACP synthase III [Acidobacteriota bacterium]
MRPHQAEIWGLGSYVPDHIMTNEDWAQRVDTSHQWIVARTGIETRRIADEDQSTIDLAEPAARAALEDAELEVGEIDELIVATDTPEAYLPDTAAFLQERLGLNKISSFDLAGSGCAGFLQALDVARARVLSGIRERVLVVGVELLTRLMNWEDRNTCVLFGDAAGAMVVGGARESSLARILAAEAGTDGGRADLLGLTAGGTRVPFSLEGAQRGEHKAVFMHGREVFREAVGRMAEVSQEVLKRAGLALKDIDLVVPHQANQRILQALTQRLGIDPQKVFSNVREFGNTGSASIPLAMDQLREQGGWPAEGTVLLVSFGAGLHWGATVLQAGG